MDAQILYKAGKYHRKDRFKPRSQRSKYIILEILIQRGRITSEELAELLTTKVQTVSKVTQSLTLSGLIVRAEEDGQCMSITDTGIRVWEEERRERQKRLECHSNPDFTEELKRSTGAIVG